MKRPSYEGLQLHLDLDMHDLFMRLGHRYIDNLHYIKFRIHVFNLLTFAK